MAARFLLLCLALPFLLAAPLRSQDDASAPLATAIEVDGEVNCDNGEGVLEPVVLGQLLEEGDRVTTGEASRLHLVLADGSSMVLGAHTELLIQELRGKGETSRSIFELFKGALNAIVEQLSTGAAFEVRAPHAVAAVKGTQFEVSAGEAESAVTVQEGDVELSDPERKRLVHVLAYQRASARLDRVDRAFDLPRRERAELEARWERARSIHGQRRLILDGLRKERASRLKEMLQRRKARRASSLKRLKEHPGAGGVDRKDIKEKRKAARERFEQAREEIQRERKEKRRKRRDSAD